MPQVNGNLLLASLARMLESLEAVRTAATIALGSAVGGTAISLAFPNKVHPIFIVMHLVVAAGAFVFILAVLSRIGRHTARDLELMEIREPPGEGGGDAPSNVVELDRRR